MTKFLLHLTERGYISDFLIKKAALFLSNRRLAESDIEKNKEKVINLLSDGVVAEKTVDEKIVKALRKKVNIATQVMGEELKNWI